MYIKEGIIGLVIGDAIGLPFEFESREYLKKNPITGMRGYGVFNLPAGSFSDDSSMVFATMRAIVDNKGEIVYSEFLEEFCQWFFNAKYTPHNRTFGSGSTTRKCLKKYRDEGKVFECCCKGERSNGNGSLMRILPLAFIEDMTPETVEKVSALTHGHLRSKIACVFYIELIKSIIEGKQDLSNHVRIASERTMEYYGDIDELIHYKEIFDESIFYEKKINVPSSGYVVDTLKAVVYVLINTDNFKDAILTAVNLGGDTDTIGAIVGGAAGVYYGFDEIPGEWVDGIFHVDKILNLCDEFEALPNTI